MGLFSGRGGTAETTAVRFLAGGSEVSCPQCRNDLFHEGQAQLNTAAMSLMNLDWANKSVTTLACSRCGFICWFADRPTPLA